MTELNAWLVELLFPDLSRAATAVTVLLSILYFISVFRKWIDK